MSIKRNTRTIYVAFYADDRIKSGEGRSGDPVLDKNGDPIVDSSRKECKDRANDVTKIKLHIDRYDRLRL